MNSKQDRAGRRSKSRRAKTSPSSAGRTDSDRRPSATSDWLVGFHSVAEALGARRRRLRRLVLRGDHDDPALAELVTTAQTLGLSVERIDALAFERLAGPELRAQGVALEAGPLPEYALERLLADMAEQPSAGRRLVLLDGVEDPQNVGAIARVADAAGCGGLVLTERHAPPLSAAVSRASAGAIEWLPVARVGNLVRAIETIKQAGYWILAADLGDGSSSLYTLPDRALTGDLALVLGAEGGGVRRLVLEQADHRICLPMRGAVASLNVSTAGAAILFELLRRAEGSGR